MLERFYPDEWLDSPYQIPWEALYEKGIRGAIFDIDNTLVPHGLPADERACRLFDRLKAIGIKTFLMSNNKEPRVAAFAGAVDTPYVSKSGKPGIKNYLYAMKQMGSDPGNTVFVGDQLFTDIFGAKRAGIYTILVKPINPREEIQIVLKRYIETIVLHYYKKKCEKQHEC